jgi:glyoxylase-like metal-dependent hydrolase (beta-lactamase superfamily II)
MAERNPLSAPGDWYIDEACIDCAAARIVAPGLIVRRGGKSVFARQPANTEEQEMAWRALLLCPTASVRRGTPGGPPAGLFPQELAPGVFRCGYNARSSFGAHAYFVTRPDGNFMVDSPRYTDVLVKAFERQGGIADVLLTHQDDVADAERYARHFSSRVVIHEDDRRAAPFATEILHGEEPVELRPGLRAIPVPGHTRGSAVFLLEERYLFSGDSLAWSDARGDLQAFRDACWFSWDVQAESLSRLAAFRFEWVLAGHGGSAHRPAEEMHGRLRDLVKRMRRQA